MIVLSKQYLCKTCSTTWLLRHLGVKLGEKYQKIIVHENLAGLKQATTG